MSVVAMSTGSVVLAIVGLILLLVVALVVLHLLESLRRPLVEIDAYAADILTAGVGIARNLDGVEQLAHTRELGMAVPGLAVRYLKKAGLA
jgi:hypothetical protein